MLFLPVLLSSTPLINMVQVKKKKYSTSFKYQDELDEDFQSTCVEPLAGTEIYPADSVTCDAKVLSIKKTNLPSYLPTYLHCHFASIV